MDSEYTQDEKTVLLDRETHEPAQGPLTDFPSPPRYEQLEDRMIYAGHRLDTQSFQAGLNPLVAAAWAVLFEVIGLRVCSGRENLGTLNDRLVLAVTQFETRALQGGVENSQVMSARYVLCSVIDEAVVTTPWGAQSEWSKMSLLSRFHNETFGGEKVFQLLERLTRDPVKHLAMLELLYLCLSLGFEGKYRVMERGVTQLEAVRDALYRQIRHVRGEPAAQAGAGHPCHLVGRPHLGVCVGDVHRVCLGAEQRAYKRAAPPSTFGVGSGPHALVNAGSNE